MTGLFTGSYRKLGGYGLHLLNGTMHRLETRPSSFFQNLAL